MLTMERLHPSGYWAVYGGYRGFQMNFDDYSEAKLYAKYGDRRPLNDTSKPVTYHRNPTPYEIKQGYGATHYRDFQPWECCVQVAGDYYPKQWFIAENDGLRYYR